MKGTTKLIKEDKIDEQEIMAQVGDGPAINEGGDGDDNQVPNQVSNQVPNQEPNQVLNQALNQIPSQVPNQVPNLAQSPLNPFMS